MLDDDMTLGFLERNSMKWGFGIWVLSSLRLGRTLRGLSGPVSFFFSSETMTFFLTLSSGVKTFVRELAYISIPGNANNGQWKP
mgnify:CR=1 FL=1